jgi:hypothetical protein
MVGAPGAQAGPGAGQLAGSIDVELTPGITDPINPTAQDWTATDVVVTGQFGGVVGASAGPVDVDVYGHGADAIALGTGAMWGTFSGQIGITGGLLFSSGHFFTEYTRVGSILVGLGRGDFAVCAGTGTCQPTDQATALVVGVLVPKTTVPITGAIFTGTVTMAGLN